MSCPDKHWRSFSLFLGRTLILWLTLQTTLTSIVLLTDETSYGERPVPSHSSHQRLLEVNGVERVTTHQRKTLLCFTLYSAWGAYVYLSIKLNFVLYAEARQAGRWKRWRHWAGSGRPWFNSALRLDPMWPPGSPSTPRCFICKTGGVSQRPGTGMRHGESVRC